MESFGACCEIIAKGENLLPQIDHILQLLARLIRDLLDREALGTAQELGVLLALQVIHHRVDVVLRVRALILKSARQVNFEIVLAQVFLKASLATGVVTKHLALLSNQKTLNYNI